MCMDKLYSYKVAAKFERILVTFSMQWPLTEEELAKSSPDEVK